jgi:hypothetical protein
MRSARIPAKHCNFSPHKRIPSGKLVQPREFLREDDGKLKHYNFSLSQAVHKRRILSNPNPWKFALKALINARIAAQQEFSREELGNWDASV